MLRNPALFGRKIGDLGELLPAGVQVAALRRAHHNGPASPNLVMAENDVVLPPSSAAGMEQMVPDLEKTTIADCGHWTQQEKPEEFNRAIIDWLNRKFAKA